MTMYYTEAEARKLIIKAGLELVEKNLVSRTWGNISARIDKDKFIITPSGRAYESLKEEDLPIVNSNDLSWTGKYKPSSEKGVHAVSYRLRNNVTFIIHTHQFFASVVGVKGENLQDVPCAGYGLPGQKKLTEKVGKAIEENPKDRSFLMKNHGAIFLGTSYEEAFEQANNLEEKCKKIVEKIFSRAVEDLGNSSRDGQFMNLIINGQTKRLEITKTYEGPEALHAQIYLNTKAQFVEKSQGPYAVEFSRKGRTLPPFLDDFAQIAGFESTFKLGNKNAVMVKDCGALCTGMNKEDAVAVSQIVEKNCACALFAPLSCRLGRPDAWLQRLVYLKKYSKQKDQE